MLQIFGGVSWNVNRVDGCMTEEADHVQGVGPSNEDKERNCIIYNIYKMTGEKAKD